MDDVLGRRQFVTSACAAVSTSALRRFLHASQIVSSDKIIANP